MVVIRSEGLEQLPSAALDSEALWGGCAPGSVASLTDRLGGRRDGGGGGGARATRPRRSLASHIAGVGGALIADRAQQIRACQIQRDRWVDIRDGAVRETGR